MADVIETIKEAVKPKEKKASEMAVFSANCPFTWKGKHVESGTVRLSHAQVLAEIKLGMHRADSRRGIVVKPNSAILNHCSLVSAGEDTKKALKRFRA